MTKYRRLILELLQQKQLPLTASQIKKQAGLKANLATVYRCLHYLTAKEYLTSFVYECSQRGIERYYAIKHSGHEHFLHCEGCHTFFHIDECPLPQSFFKRLQRRKGFRVANHTLTLSGICPKCHS